MHIALFGAATRLGSHVLEQAIAAGHRVTALVGARSELPTERDDLRVVIGEVTSEQAVAQVVDGSHAVVSVLGAGISRRTTPVCLEGVRAMLGAMKTHDVGRILVVSAHGVGETYDRSAYVRLTWRRAAEAMLDLEAMEQLLRSTDADWTIVRPPRMTGGTFTGTYEVVEDDARVGMFSGIPRADVADFVLAAALDGTYVHQAVSIRTSR